MRLAHYELGHNGSARTYMIVHRPYYWKGLKVSLIKHAKQYLTYQKRNIQVVKYAQLHISTPRLPMQFISMDFIDPFDPSSNGH